MKGKVKVVEVEWLAVGLAGGGMASHGGGNRRSLAAPSCRGRGPAGSCGLPGPRPGGLRQLRGRPPGQLRVRALRRARGHHPGAGGLLLGRARSGTSDHTLDLGVYQTRADAGRPWGRADFRGWGGSGYRDVTVTPQGFSSAAQYDADPKAYVPGRTTRSFVPGPIPAGRWAAELGLANIDPTDLDGVAYRVEVKYYRDRAFAANPYRRPRPQPGPGAQRHGLVRGRLPRARRALG